MARPVSPLRDGNGGLDDIMSAYRESELTEALLRQHLQSNGFTDLNLETKLDTLRLTVQDHLNDEYTEESLRLAQKWISACKSFQDATYYTIVADRGHPGRALLYLDRIPRPGQTNISTEMEDPFRNYQIETQSIGDSPKDRTIPMISDDLLLVDVLFDPEQNGGKLPINGIDFDTTTIGNLASIVADNRKCSATKVQFVMGNCILSHDRTLKNCRLRPGTVMFYDIKQ